MQSKLSELKEILLSRFSDELDIYEANELPDGTKNYGITKTFMEEDAILDATEINEIVNQVKKVSNTVYNLYVKTENQAIVIGFIARASDPISVV
jgi:hypothetical protein